MGYILSLTYWIPWIWLSSLGHPLHGMGCGIACWAVVMFVLVRI